MNELLHSPGRRSGKAATPARQPNEPTLGLRRKCILIQKLRPAHGTTKHGENRHGFHFQCRVKCNTKTRSISRKTISPQTPHSNAQEPSTLLHSGLAHIHRPNLAAMTLVLTRSPLPSLPPLPDSFNALVTASTALTASQLQSARCPHCLIASLRCGSSLPVAHIHEQVGLTVQRLRLARDRHVGVVEQHPRGGRAIEAVRGKMSLWTRGRWGR
jgi:hypothetical protein